MCVHLKDTIAIIRSSFAGDRSIDTCKNTCTKKQSGF